jgi:hypothetical protein
VAVAGIGVLVGGTRDGVIVAGVSVRQALRMMAAITLVIITAFLVLLSLLRMIILTPGGTRLY